MATATATRKPREFTCRFVSITIEITDIRYSVDPIPAGEMGTHAFRLTKHSGDHASYDVIRTHFGLIECTCADFEFRRKGDTAEPCRHGRALVELGLIPGPTPALVSEANWATRSQAPRLLESIRRAATADAATGPACCPSGEPSPCVACETSAPALCPSTTCQGGSCDGCMMSAAYAPADDATDSATAILARGLELARTEAINQSVATSDHYPDECPEFDPVTEFDPAEDLVVLDVGAFEPSAEDLTDFGTWKRESAARDHLDHSDRLTLAELVDRQTEFYRGWRNPAGEMIARAMDELALKIRMTGAETPDELEARVEILEQDIRHDWEARGYEEGRRAGCKCGEVVIG